MYGAVRVPRRRTAPGVSENTVPAIGGVFAVLQSLRRRTRLFKMGQRGKWQVRKVCTAIRLRLGKPFVGGVKSISELWHRACEDKGGLEKYSAKRRCQSVNHYSMRDSPGL